MPRILRFVVPLAAALAMTVVVPFPPAPGVAQEASPTASCPMTTPEENVALVQQWFTALSEGSGEDVAALAAPDLGYHAPSPDLPPQTDGAGTWANKRLQDYPDLNVTLEHVFSAGDMVASYVRFEGTHVADTEDAQGVPATGLSVAWVTMVHFRVECGKIAEVWSVADDLGRLQRLGVITAEELQSAEPVATPVP